MAAIYIIFRILLVGGLGLTLKEKVLTLNPGWSLHVLSSRWFSPISPTIKNMYTRSDSSRWL